MLDESILKVLRDNVARGARLLDDRVPGWEWDLDPYHLRLFDFYMSSTGLLDILFKPLYPGDCDGYLDGLYFLGLQPHPDVFIPEVQHIFDRDTEDHGFDLPLSRYGYVVGTDTTREARREADVYTDECWQDEVLYRTGWPSVRPSHRGV